MVLLRQKIDVPGRHYSNQLAAHFACFCHGDPRETVSYFCFKYIPHRVPRTHHHWVCDEALLEFLARANSFVGDTQTQLFWENKITSYPDVPTLTLRTSLAWNSAVQLWWIIPIPPINWKENREISETVSRPLKLSLVFVARAGSWWNETDATCLCAVLVLTAMAMAMEDSVTVSMGDEMRGVFRVIFLVNADVRSSSLYAFRRWTRQDFMTLKEQ